MAQRLDAYLVAQGLIKSRERAKQIRKNGGVRVNGRVAAKAALAVSEQDEITCEEDPLGFVHPASSMYLRSCVHSSTPVPPFLLLASF